MVWYAAAGPRRARQIVGDVWVVVWCAVWIWVSTLVFGVVDAIAGPARSTARTSAGLEQKLREAGDKVGGVPGVGDELSVPFRELADGLSQVTSQATAQAALIHQAAWVIAVVTAILPVVIMLAFWVPPRLRFSREAAAAQKFIDADPDLDLFALRAMTSVPMSRLARISDDPVGAWRRGDRDVINALATLELDRVGLRKPASRRDREGQLRRARGTGERP